MGMENEENQTAAAGGGERKCGAQSA